MEEECCTPRPINSPLIEPHLLLLLTEVKLRAESGQDVSKEHLQRLHFLFPQIGKLALDLIDRQKVKAFKAHNGRTLYQVKESASIMIQCSSLLNYCNCDFFHKHVLEGNRDPLLLCQHLLAIRLAKAMGRMQETTVSSTQIVDIISSSFS